MNQLDLFDLCRTCNGNGWVVIGGETTPCPACGVTVDDDPPSQRHSAESVASAEQIQPNAATLRARVLELLQQRGDYGGTDEELQNVLRMNPSTERPRRIELVRAGLVVKSTMQRKTSSGRTAAVWVAVEAR